MRDFRLFNKAILRKWFWRFMNGKGNLWRKVVAIKYDTTNFGWYPSLPNGSYGCNLWRYISKILNVGKVYFLIFPLRVMDLLFLFGTISGVGKVS